MDTCRIFMLRSEVTCVLSIGNQIHANKTIGSLLVLDGAWALLSRTWNLNDILEARQQCQCALIDHEGEKVPHSHHNNRRLLCASDANR